MPHTSDNDKKAKDNNAVRMEKTCFGKKTAKPGKTNIQRKRIIYKFKKTRRLAIFVFLTLFSLEKLADWRFSYPS